MVRFLAASYPMNKFLIEKLKTLQFERSNKSPFINHIEFLKWADKVSPLLSFDNKLKTSFDKYVLSAKVTHRIDNNIDSCNNLNDAIGILNQAVLSLETNTIKTDNTKNNGIEYPRKITLKWIWEHVPAKYYWSFFLILVFVFSLGIAFSHTNLYKSLTDVATAIIKINKNIAPIKE